MNNRPPDLFHQRTICSAGIALMCIQLFLRRAVWADEYAVIIGANDYTNLRPLEYSGKDAVALRDRIIESGFPQENVYCLFDAAKENRARPFREIITQHVELISNNADEEDLLFIWFSGHGVQVSGKSYLCGVDSRLDNPQSMIEVDWVFHQLKKSKARRKVLIVDACRNEVEPPGRRSGLATQSNEILRALHKPPQGLLVITSTDAGQYAVEDEKLGHGVFAHFVLEALSGKGDTTKDGELTWRELFTYSARKTRDYVARTHLTAQRPRISRAEELSLEDFVLARVSKPQSAIVDLTHAPKVRAEGKIKDSKPVTHMDTISASVFDVTRIKDSKPVTHMDTISSSFFDLTRIKDSKPITHMDNVQFSKPRHSLKANAIWVSDPKRAVYRAMCKNQPFDFYTERYVLLLRHAAEHVDIQAQQGPWTKPDVNWGTIFEDSLMSLTSSDRFFYLPDNFWQPGKTGHPVVQALYQIGESIRSGEIRTAMQYKHALDATASGIELAESDRYGLGHDKFYDVRCRRSAFDAREVAYQAVYRRQPSTTFLVDYAGRIRQIADQLDPGQRYAQKQGFWPGRGFYEDKHWMRLVENALERLEFSSRKERLESGTSASFTETLGGVVTELTNAANAAEESSSEHQLINCAEALIEIAEGIEQAISERPSNLGPSPNGDGEVFFSDIRQRANVEYFAALESQLGFDEGDLDFLRKETGVLREWASSDFFNGTELLSPRGKAGCLQALGRAQYRVGEFADASRMITRSLEASAELSKHTVFTNLFIQAMAEHQLGHAEHARDLFERGRAILEQTKYVDERDTKKLFREADAIINN